MSARCPGDVRALSWPLFVTANLALKRIDHLMHTQHVAIDVGA